MTLVINALGGFSRGEMPSFLVQDNIHGAMIVWIARIHII